MTRPALRTVVATNLAQNPGYELGAGSFLSASAGNYVLTADTAAPIAGARSALYTRVVGVVNATVAIAMFCESTSAGKIKVTAGQSITGAVAIKTDVTDASISTRWYWYDAGNVQTNGAITQHVPAAVAGQVYRVVSTVTVPDTAVTAYFVAFVNVKVGTGNALAGQRMWADQLTLEYGATDGAYFDGDTPDTAEFTYDWTGTPHGSTSTKTTVDVVPPEPEPEPLALSVSLWVDGARVADGSALDEAQDAPTALSGLRVTWGRSTTIDQVSPSTATFDVADRAGGASFLGLLYVGADVEVHAYGDVPAPPTLPINADPSFENQPVGDVPAGWDTSTHTDSRITNADADTGTQSVAMTPLLSPGQDVLSVDVRPAPPGGVGDWDYLPTMQEGQVWAVTATLRPTTSTVYLYTMAYASPSAQPSVIGWTSPAVIPRQWQTITAETVVPAEYAGRWVGVRVQFVGFPTWSDFPQSWDQMGTTTWNELATAYVDDLQLLAPESASIVHRDALVFSGRITDLDAKWDSDVDGVVCSVIAQDFTADLANRDVGDEPWAAETLATRFRRIITAAGVPVRYTIAPTLQKYVVTYMDVDRQQVWPLLADLATSVDGILWSATHTSTGPYLWLTDPRTQSALYVLALDDTSGLVEIVPTSASAAAITVDACDVLLEPVVFRQTVGDVVTRVALTWQEQTVDDDGKPAPTDRTLTVIDTIAEQAQGTRRLAVSTVLTKQTDAQAVADLLIGRLRAASWRVAGLTWETDDQMTREEATNSLDLLDGTRRIGAAILLTNLPGWIPSGASTLPLLLQGGVYGFDDGRWTLDLVTSSAASQGTALPWPDVKPAWSWQQFDPAIAWTDLVGVAGT